MPDRICNASLFLSPLDSSQVPSRHLSVTCHQEMTEGKSKSAGKNAPFCRPAFQGTSYLGNKQGIRKGAAFEMSHKSLSHCCRDKGSQKKVGWDKEHAAQGRSRGPSGMCGSSLQTWPRLVDCWYSLSPDGILTAWGWDRKNSRTEIKITKRNFF
jgi:hypothetical protein